MTNRYQSGLPVPHQGVNRQAHPDSYTGYPAAVNPHAAYGAPNQQNPNGFRVEVSFPNQAAESYPPGGNVYGGAANANRQAYRGNRRQPQGYGAMPAAAIYGNPVVIRVSDANWTDALVAAMEQGQGVDLIFDADNVVRDLVQAIENEIGSFGSAIERFGRGVLDKLFSAGLAYPNPNVPAQAMVAPAVVAAIVVVALAIIGAVVAIYNINASRRIAELAIERGCDVEDIETSGSSEGSSSGWFDFLSGSRWQVRCGVAQ
ncbi:MAG: hypothetical protein KZQ99_10055 [Candidatus Thiodiazotropha sp. (ex Dulcina madagascariensis)]|nr:hypothetical protein [Candidatus Thiodiazotropha sp. (ex Dulcina madagascariensis)]